MAGNREETSMWVAGCLTGEVPRTRVHRRQKRACLQGCVWLLPSQGSERGPVTCEAVPTQAHCSRLWISVADVAWVTHVGGSCGYVGTRQLPHQPVTTDHFVVYVATWHFLSDLARNQEGTDAWWLLTEVRLRHHKGHRIGLTWWRSGKNLPANAGDPGLISGLGRSQVPRYKFYI